MDPRSSPSDDETLVIPTEQNGENPEHDQHVDRMATFMSDDGKWSGGFANCSKNVQGRLVYQIAQNAWKRGDFPGVNFTTVNFKDEVAKKYMEWQFSSRLAARVKSSANVKDLLTMTKAQQSKVVPADIKKKFQQRKQITDQDLRDLQSYPSSAEPLVITGRNDKKILALRIRIPPHFLDTLRETKPLLPQHSEKSGRRGDYKTRNYCLWAKYADHPYLSGDLLEDGEEAMEWLSAQAPLFQYLSEQLKLWDFESYQNMRTHPWLDKLMVKKAHTLGQKIVPGQPQPTNKVPLHTVAGVWYGLAVNCDQEFAGVPHRDEADVKNSMNCVIPWGTFTGADLLLWELKKRVQVSEGEVIFFRSKALTHNVSPLTAGSNRNVLDLYSHQAVLEVDRKRRRPQDKTLTVNPAEKSKQKRRQT